MLDVLVNISQGGRALIQLRKDEQAISQVEYEGIKDYLFTSVGHNNICVYVEISRELGEVRVTVKESPEEHGKYNPELSVMKSTRKREISKGKVSEVFDIS